MANDADAIINVWGVNTEAGDRTSGSAEDEVWVSMLYFFLSSRDETMRLK